MTSALLLPCFVAPVALTMASFGSVLDVMSTVCVPEPWFVAVTWQAVVWFFWIVSGSARLAQLDVALLMDERDRQVQDAGLGLCGLAFSVRTTWPNCCAPAGASLAMVILNDLD